MMRQWLFCCIFAVLLFDMQAQQGFRYREFSDDICSTCLRKYNRIPDEVQFEVYAHDGYFIVYCNQEQWFDEFFSGGGGFSLLSKELSLGVKMVSTDYFDCDNRKSNLSESYFYQLPPLSFSEMDKRKEYLEDGDFVINLGAVPEVFEGKDFDHGIIISKRNRKCIDHWYNKIPVHDWQLLNHALLLDTLVYYDDLRSYPQIYAPITDEIKLEFEVLFPKDQVTFNRDSIRQIVSKLHIPEGFSVFVDINAYASVEGPVHRNAQLYHTRGEVISALLHPFLEEKAQYTISVSENWDEFFRDIATTNYRSLASESPDNIRMMLNERQLSLELEPILKKHRKAIVNIRAIQTLDPLNSAPDDMIRFYHHAIEKGEVDKALLLQDAIFSKMEREKIIPGFPDVFPIPATQRMSYVYNREITHRYFFRAVDLVETYNLFQQMVEFYPEDPRLRFNLAELAFRRWFSGDTSIKNDKLLELINKLEAQGVPRLAVNRLLINYHMVNLRYGMADADQRLRNRSVRAIRNLYAETHTREAELVNLAMFFTAYRQMDFSERLLRKQAYSSSPDVDLLFFYIAITINNSKYYNMRGYKGLLLKAHASAPDKFCQLFQPVRKTDAVGISLLFRPELMEIFCSHCKDQLL
jgi:hypothetical protein